MEIKKKACKLIKSALDDEADAKRKYTRVISAIRAVSPEQADRIEKIVKDEVKHKDTLRSIHRRIC